MNKTITLRLSKVLTWIVCIGALLVAGTAVYWSAQPSTVLIVKNSPVPVQPPEVEDGGKVYLNIDFCKEIAATGVTKVNLVGDMGAIIAVNWPIDNSPKQCYMLEEVPVPIPAQTPSDNYYVEFVVCYSVNPIKSNQCTTFISQKFKVVNKKLKPGDARADIEAR